MQQVSHDYIMSWGIKLTVCFWTHARCCGVSWTPTQLQGWRKVFPPLKLLLSCYREFTEFNGTEAERKPGLISRHSHTAQRPTETLSIGQAPCVPSAGRLSFTRALPRLPQQPQKDSIKPCASCVIPTSCTQGRECSAVFVCWGRPVSSPVPMSQQSHTGKNIQLCAWKPRRLSEDETAVGCSLFLSNSSPHRNNHGTATSLWCSVQCGQQMAVLVQVEASWGTT